MQAVELASDTVFEDGELRILAYQASHPPIDPALGFRVEYRGRSVVISGDSNVTDATLSISSGADLLLHDALSVPAVTSMSEGLLLRVERGSRRLWRMCWIITLHSNRSSN